MNRAFRVAWHDIRRNGAQSVATIFSVFITAMIIGVFIIGLATTGNAINTFEEGIRITAEVNDDINQEELVNQLSEIEGIGRVEFSDKDEQIDIVIQSYGEYGEVFELYKGDSNPLSDVFYLYPSDVADVIGITEQIQDVEGVTTAYYGGEGMDALIENITKFRIISTVGAFIVILIPFFLISNTIKLSIISRRTEIEIMRLVGATGTYIKRPFLAEGFLFGIFGGIIASGLLAITYGLIYHYFNGALVVPILRMYSPSTFIPFFIASITILSGFIGVLGANNSIRRYLKV